MSRQEMPDKPERSDGWQGVEGGRNPSIPIGAVAGLIVLALSVVFVLQNTQKTKVNFLWMNFHVGTWLLILVSMVLGAILGIVIPWLRRCGKVRSANDKAK